MQSHMHVPAVDPSFRSRCFVGQRHDGSRDAGGEVGQGALNHFIHAYDHAPTQTRMYIGAQGPVVLIGDEFLFV